MASLEFTRIPHHIFNEENTNFTQIISVNRGHKSPYNLDIKCDKDITKKENYIPTSFINRHNNPKQNLANEIYSRVARAV